MNRIYLVLFLLPSFAFALPLSSLQCRGISLTYSVSVPNGGAPEPQEDLVVGGKTLIHRGLDVPAPTVLADFHLVGAATSVSTQKTLDGTYTSFQQNAVVSDLSVVYFKGIVFCTRFHTSHGPLP